MNDFFTENGVPGDGKLFHRIERKEQNSKTMYASIVVTWQDTAMKQRTGTLDGFPAQLVQHAIDHCDGILI